MAQPNLYPINAFDKSNSHQFPFSWQGNQAVKNRLIIRNNATNAEVYNQIQSTYQLYHTLPANTLINGVLYNAQISVFDASNVESILSTKVLFYCYTSPTFIFDNLTSNQIVENSSYELLLQYSQIESEPLNSYQFNLYNFGQRLIYQSGLKYDTSNLKGVISGLEDNTSYYIQATGRTLNGMELDTGLIPITVEYQLPSMYALVGLENIPEQGSIKIQSNIISLLGTSSPSPPAYIDDSKVDLTASDSWVKFEEGFSLQKDFTIELIANNLTYNVPFIELSNNVYKIEVNIAKKTFSSVGTEKAYLELRAYNKITNYYVISNLIDVPTISDNLHIWIRRVNNLYELKLENLG